MACMLLFAQCKKASDNSIQPTGSYDTLGIHWAVIEEANIVYYFQDFSAQSTYARQYVDAHESAYSTLNAVFNAQLPQKLRFFIWADPALAAQLLGRQLGFTVPLQCVCNVRSDRVHSRLSRLAVGRARMLIPCRHQT
jgi:hypothetical protein